jgi:thioredoxin 1
MNSKHEHFISEGDKEMKRISEKKIGQLIKLKEQRQKMAPEPVHVADANFKEIVNQHSLALIDCWAGWCGPCIALTPTIEELAKEYAGKVLVGKLNVDENPRTTEQFQIFSIPTMLIVKNGKEVDRIIGLCPKNHIESILKKHLG